MTMRWLLIVVMVASIGGFILLVSLNGVGRIAAEVDMIGWGFVPLILIRLLALGLAALGWAAATASAGRVRPQIFVGLRLIREGINCLLPVAQVGGDVIGGRLLSRYGFGIGVAMASILVDLFLQAATQGVFAAIGLIALWRERGDTPVVHEASGFLLIGIPAVAGFFLAQRFGLFLLVDRGVGLFNKWCRRGTISSPTDVQQAILMLYAHRRDILGASLLHLVAWFVGVAEMWTALWFMGLPATASESLILESLAQALRSAAFGVPGALGVQEGGLIVLGGLFGIPTSSAIALSIAKRLPDIAIGLPGVMAWQYLEVSMIRARGTH